MWILTARNQTPQSDNYQLSKDDFALADGQVMRSNGDGTFVLHDENGAAMSGSWTIENMIVRTDGGTTINWKYTPPS